MKTGAPVGGKADEGANGDGDEAGAEPGVPKANPVAPFCPGSVALVAAGDAGWLPNAKGLDVAVAVVGVGAAKLNPAGWLNGLGLTAAELAPDAGWPNDELCAIGGAPNAKAGDAPEGVAGDVKAKPPAVGAAVLISGAF